MRPFIAFIFCACLALSVDARAEDMHAEKAAIQAQAVAFSHAYVAGDTDTLMAIYAPDASIVPTNRPILRGTDNIRAYWAPHDGAKWHPVDHKTTTTELTIHGDVATDIGYFEGVSADMEGNTRAFRGAYLITWRKIDGVWRMQHDMWNSLKVPDGD
ncbi:YybH family protein [Kordiimonas sp.]|uniref:YybH family protein n=1 Tax=Kordiimonas sp. TaxID=1970157 RepID=UPI003A934AAC